MSPVVTHTCNPSTQWVEGSEILSLDDIVSVRLAYLKQQPKSTTLTLAWVSLSDAFDRDL